MLSKALRALLILIVLAILASNASAYIPHKPIKIDGNDEFTAENGVVRGSGTKDDPYVIEGWDVKGILIRNTDAYFVIRNCSIHDSIWGGIYLYNVENGRIKNNEIYNNNDDGIVLLDSQNNSIENNKIYNNRCGIHLWDSQNNTIKRNKFTNDGIFIDGRKLEHFIQTISENKVNGKPLYYFLNQSNKIIDGKEVGQIILVNCNNFKIRNVEISNTSVGIELAFSSNGVIEDSEIYNNFWRGIDIISSENNRIVNSKIYSNSCEGIYLWKSQDNKIEKNEIYNNSGYGICIYNSQNNSINSNEIYSNSFDGVSLHNSQNSNVNNNEVYNNFWNGIGIYDSQNNSIDNNSIYKNSLCGIEVYISKNNTIAKNKIYNNSNIGIFLWSLSQNNTIYLNNFINSNNTYLGYSTNIWHSPNPIVYTYKGKTYKNYLGNHWSDYEGEDKNGDGIGDTAYVIDSENRDRYPLIKPVENYIIK